MRNPDQKDASRSKGKEPTMKTVSAELLRSYVIDPVAYQGLFVQDPTMEVVLHFLIQTKRIREV